jgi:hypothetical protein
METKEYLISVIKQWVKLENEIKTLKKEQVQRQIEKKKVSENLIDIMKKNDIDCLDIKDGQICYNKKNIKKALSKKHLMDVLSKYYEGDMLKASEVNSFIIENREEVTKESITIKSKASTEIK